MWIGCCLLVLFCAAAIAEGAEPAIVFVQLPPGARDSGEGGRIVVRGEQGTLTVLTREFHSAADPDVSFDGKRILFAAKKNASDLWAIYEVNADGSEVRQVTRVQGNCRQPGYQSLLNTLVAERPWYQITFVSDMAGELNEQGTGLSTSLYSCKLDGTLVTRLTFNPSSDTDPFLHHDGRLIFASWQRRSLDRGVHGRTGLFGVNLDGTDFALFSADEGRRVKRMPCTTAGGLTVFIEPFEPAWDGAGGVSSVRLRRHLHSYRAITRKEDGLFHSPSPLPDGSILISRRPANGSGTHGIYRMDPESGTKTLVFDDPAFHDVQAKLLATRPEPDGRSTSVFVPTGDVDDPTTASYAPSNPMGKLYCMNSHISDLDTSVWPGKVAIKRLRVLEGIPKREGDPAPADPAGTPPLLQRRILGDIPVEEDGSFNIQVPADIPIELQLLDGAGLALRSCGWIWVKNNEPRGCIGCHEDGELVPENRMTAALKKPSIPLTLPPDRRRSIDFTRDVMPVLEKKCTSCHRSGSPLIFDASAQGGYSRVYTTLLRPDGGTGSSHVFGLYVHPGRARTSPLIWHLFGRNTSRPWDGKAQLSPVEPMPPPGSVPLTESEKRVFIEWIDTGALWMSVPAGPRGDTGTGTSERGKR